jgi:hypothetical protein
MDKKHLIILIFILIVGGLLAAAIVVSPFILRPNADESIQWATARTTLSAITIPIILGGFYFSTIQFRKALSKPKIRVAFNENGDQQAELKYINLNPCSLPPLWLINEGNAISDRKSVV